MKIKGTSPITKENFTESDLKIYGSIKNEKELKEHFKKLDAFDYSDLLTEFLEFKKQNPDLCVKPQTVIENKAFEALRNNQILPKL